MSPAPRLPPVQLRRRSILPPPRFIDDALLAAHAHRIISLGSFCIVASIMKRFGIKRSSMPFDWLFARPEIVLRCLADDFREYLDTRHYRSHTHEDWRRCSHALYDLNPPTEMLFNHRDPTQPGDYAYVQRCVDRFRAVMADDRDKLFVMINNRGELSPDMFHRISGRVREMTRHSHFIAIDVAAQSGLEGCQSMSVLAHADNHSLYRQHPVIQSAGVEFPYDLDNLVVLALIQQALRKFAPPEQQV